DGRAMFWLFAFSLHARSRGCCCCFSWFFTHKSAECEGLSCLNGCKGWRGTFVKRVLLGPWRVSSFSLLSRRWLQGGLRCSGCSCSASASTCSLAAGSRWNSGWALVAEKKGESTEH